MFYRVGKFKHELGKTDEIMDFFKETICCDSNSNYYLEIDLIFLEVVTV